MVNKPMSRRAGGPESMPRSAQTAVDFIRLLSAGSLSRPPSRSNKAVMVIHNRLAFLFSGRMTVTSVRAFVYGKHVRIREFRIVVV